MPGPRLQAGLLAVLLTGSIALAGAADPTAAAAAQPGGDVAAGDSSAPADDECGKESLEGYNLGLHIGTVFILLGVSVLGCAIPFLFHLKRHPVLYAITKLGAFFGFGTIVATAFIHMLPPANEQLSSPCLPPSWNDAYGAWAFLFTLLAVLAMQLLDYLIEGFYIKFSEAEAGAAAAGALPTGAVVSIHSSQAILSEAPNPGLAARKDKDSGDEESQDVELAERVPCAVHGDKCAELLPRPADASQVMGIYLMEAGIVFHSVLVGITLGVTAGGAFRTLIVALSFHQFFEGFAIVGTAVDAGLSLKKLALLAGLFSVTTPAGVAVGIAVRRGYDGSDTGTLLVQGIFDALSAGILIYVVLVELITPHFTQSKWLREQRRPVKALAFLALYSGVAVMAVLGRWA